MQNSGVELTLGTMITWVFMNANIGVMGVILPLYAIIDMIETAENVWSDSCVCAMTNKDLSK